MPLTVRDIMEVDVPAVYPEDPIEKVVHVLRDHELPGVPVINEGGRCVGIITESDLIMAGEKEDLHLPHYVELFGGFVFLESTKKFEDRPRKAIAPIASHGITQEPGSIAPHATNDDAARTIAPPKPKPPPPGAHS